MVNYYYLTLSFVLNKYAPLKTVTVTPRTSSPRFTTELLNERCKRRQLENNWQKTKKELDKLLRKKSRIYNSLLKKVQSNYFSSLFGNFLDSKSFWRSIDKVLHRSNPSQQIPLSIHSADQFSSFFSDKIKTIRLNLPLININPFSVPNKSPPIFSLFKPVSFDEIKLLILSISKSTCQLDPIPSYFLPYCIDSIVLIVTRIVNLSLNTCTFPNEFKSAFVKPLLKRLNLNLNDLKNYRPTSNLSFPSKLTERVIVDRLLPQLSAQKLKLKF